MGGVPSGGNTLKNILIGVFTTVVAYLIVHFILDKKKGNEDLEKNFNATENAFRSVNDYINLADLKLKTIACFSCDKAEMKKEMLRELNQLSSNLKKIAENTAVDEKMRSIAELTMQQFEDERPLYKNFFDSAVLIEQMPEAERQVYASSLTDRFMKKLKYLQDRDTAEIKAFRDNLVKRYKRYIGKDDFVFIPNETIFNPDVIARKWRVECLYHLDIKPDNTVVFIAPSDEIKGKWRLDDHDLYLDLDNGEKLHYHIEELSSKLMRIRFDEVAIANVACPE
jgi:hypothetical protein